MNKLIITRTVSSSSVIKPSYDAIVIGGGHNGLVAAAYLAKGGKKVALFEKRHIVGGAAVTEEIIPGFKFSRASYVLGLLRPKVYYDLDLKNHGLKVYQRDPSSFTPLHESYWNKTRGKSLTLGLHRDFNCQQIAQFSKKDSLKYPQFESMLEKFSEAISPLLDSPPVKLGDLTGSALMKKLRQFFSLMPLLKLGRDLGKDFPHFYTLMTGSTTKILNQWFESEPLKASLATDSVIGAVCSPSSPGSGYILLHHVMAQIAGVRGAWGYPAGGMGGVTQAMRRAAEEAGASIFTSQPVKKILIGDNGGASGVELEEGQKVYAKFVLSNATPYITYLKLLQDNVLTDEFRESIENIDYKSAVCKINVALKEVPNFKAIPNSRNNSVMPHHKCTIHLNCENTEMIEEAFLEGRQGMIPRRPMIEMTIPSSCDSTLAPPGHHVALFFTQYAPYTLSEGKTWDDDTKKAYAKKIFDTVEEYAPGFVNSVIGYEVLPPPDLEAIFGLTGGNIFHGALTFDQLFSFRPSHLAPGPYTPIKGLWLCGSGAHPGGGVMGAPGRLAALGVLGKI